jgi:hypothetical protein
MTPKEKAEELFNKMDSIIYTDQDWKRQCILGALLVVNEILYLDCFDMSEEHFENHINYYEQVKQEIEKL